jgi:hypothetical protein
MRLRLAVLLPIPVSLALIGASGVGTAAESPARETPDLALVISGRGGTTAVRSGKPYFAALWQLLQPTRTGTERVSGAWVKGGYPPVRITVFWALTGVGGRPQPNRPSGGQVAVQQQDQLFVDEDGTPWVRTDPVPEVHDDNIRWHRAPRWIFDRLEREGRLGESMRVDSPDVITDYAAEPPADAEPGPAADGVWWGAAGLAVGVGGTLLIRRAAARREAGPPREEARQELIDL